jgi:hypothetical protein
LWAQYQQSMIYYQSHHHRIREATAAMKPSQIGPKTTEGTNQSTTTLEEKEADDGETKTDESPSTQQHHDSSSSVATSAAATTSTTSSHKRPATIELQGNQKRIRSSSSSGLGDSSSTAPSATTPTTSQHSDITTSSHSSLNGAQQQQQATPATFNAIQSQSQQNQQNAPVNIIGAMSTQQQFNQSSLLLSTASAGGVQQQQHSQLASSILALQQQQQHQHHQQHQAAQLAVAGQLIANNPLMGQFYLQQLLMGGAAGGSNYRPLPMGLSSLGPMYTAMGQQQHNFGGQPVPGGPGQSSRPPDGMMQHNAVGNPQATFSMLGPGMSQGMHPSRGMTMSAPHMNRGDLGGSGRVGLPGSQQQKGGPPSLQSLGETLTAESIGPDVPESLPIALALSDDDLKLSAWQVLLRNQIEAFSASNEDIATHARGRNRPITLGQVGIRCRHCKRQALNLRNKGSVYFPFSLLGLYQAAQNMGSSHFCGESCDEMSQELKEKFDEVLTSKSTVGSGKQYWAKAAGRLGLLDTEQGIRFIRDVIIVSA